MAEAFKRIIAFSSNETLWKTAVAVFLIWSGLRILCWILGAVGLRCIGRRGQYRPYWIAWLPFGQLWYEIRLTHHRNSARRAIPCLWWMAALCAAALTAALWAANGALGGMEVRFVKLLLIVAGVLALGSLYCYVRVRILEFHALRSYLADSRLWVFSLVFTILGVPIQKIFFFFNRNNLD